MATFKLKNPKINLAKEKQFQVEKLEERVILPEGHLKSAGLDLRVLTEDGKPVLIKPGEYHKFRTGIKIAPPEREYVEIHVRSSVGCKKHLALMNGTGIIDEDYRGEILVFLWNFGSEDVWVEDNERVCQMIFHRYRTHIPVLVESVDETERGESGFGSSGRF